LRNSFRYSPFSKWPIKILTQYGIMDNRDRKYRKRYDRRATVPWQQ